MQKVLHYRAMGSLCRQSAVFNPLNSWKLLGDAERWEHLAAVEIVSHFKECNTTSSSDAVKSGGSSDANDTRWKTIAGASRLCEM
jgi:hypothetical protein